MISRALRQLHGPDARARDGCVMITVWLAAPEYRAPMRLAVGRIGQAVRSLPRAGRAPQSASTSSRVSGQGGPAAGPAPSRARAITSSVPPGRTNARDLRHRFGARRVGQRLQRVALVHEIERAVPVGRRREQVGGEEVHVRESATAPSGSRAATDRTRSCASLSPRSPPRCRRARSRHRARARRARAPRHCASHAASSGCGARSAQGICAAIVAGGLVHRLEPGAPIGIARARIVHRVEPRARRKPPRREVRTRPESRHCASVAAVCFFAVLARAAASSAAAVRRRAPSRRAGRRGSGRCRAGRRSCRSA